MLDALRASLEEMPWLECWETRVTEEEGRLALVGEWVVPYLEGVEQLVYLVSDAAVLAGEEGIAGARLHAELLPLPAEEAQFRFRVWTDPLPHAAFERLVGVLIEALALVAEESEGGEEDELIQIDGL